METFYSVRSTRGKDSPWVHNRKHEFGYHFDFYPDIMGLEAAHRIYREVQLGQPQGSFEVVEFKYTTVPVDPNYYPL